MDRDQWPVWASRRQGRADDSHPSRGARDVGDDRERRRADIGKPIGARELARRPTQRLHGIALSGIGTTVIVKPQRDLSVAKAVRNGPVRHAGVEHGRRDVVAQVLERHARVAARLGKSIAQRVRSDWPRPVGITREDVFAWPRFLANFFSRLRASWRSKASLTESISGTSRQSDSLVGLRTRPTPGAPSAMANAA